MLPSFMYMMACSSEDYIKTLEFVQKKYPNIDMEIKFARKAIE
jgi:hypothetical protein